MDKRNIAGINNDTTLISLGNTSSGSIALIPIVPIVPAVSNLLDLGTSSQRWRNIFSYGLNASGDVTPSASISYNLGSSGNRWGTLYTTAFDCTDNCAFGGIPYPKTSNTYDLGTSSQRWKDTYVVNVNASGNLLPSVDNASDLGSTSKRWRNIYRVPQYLEATKTTGSATSGSAVNMTWDTITTNTISGLTYNAGTGVFTYVGADILLNVSVYALILFNTTGVRNVTITSTAGLLSKSYVGASSASDTVLNCSTLVPLTTGQQLWFVHFQNSGSTLTTTGRCTMYLV